MRPLHRKSFLLAVCQHVTAPNKGLEFVNWSTKEKCATIHIILYSFRVLRSSPGGDGSRGGKDRNIPDHWDQGGRIWTGRQQVHHPRPPLFCFSRYTRVSRATCSWAKKLSGWCLWPLFWSFLRVFSVVLTLPKECHWGFFCDRLAFLVAHGKESLRDAGIPALGRSPWEGQGKPLLYSSLENPHGRKSLVGYSPWSCKELDTTEVTEHAYSQGWFNIVVQQKLTQYCEAIILQLNILNYVYSSVLCNIVTTLGSLHHCLKKSRAHWRSPA